jgi:quinohemoprotein ethanol dehydrogenase
MVCTFDWSGHGGTLTTAGNLVVQGQVTGELSVYAADTGRELWSFDAQTGIVAQPITYLAGGKQYLTVIVGWRGMGSSSGMKPEWEYRLQPRRVLTFALDGKLQLPPVASRSSDFVGDAAFVIDPAKVAVGQALASSCSLCHGVGFASGGTAPDLRKSAIPLSADAFASVLHDGLLLARGMPRFEEFTPEQLEGLRHFIRQRERESSPQQPK